MSDRSDVIYRYDGSFEGLMCCVFESYAARETPADIIGPQDGQVRLLEQKEIVFDAGRCGRVLRSIPERMGAPALDLVRRAYLSCLPQKELHILRFLRLGYERGPAVTSMLADPAVDTLVRAVKHLNNESGLLAGFIRFSDYDGSLVAQIEPKNCVLPLLSRHFCRRYPEERFCIWDRTHGLALLYEPYTPRLVSLDRLELPEAGREETEFRRLWKLFYDTVAVEGRQNPGCRRSHMPMRYWEYMTEMRPVLPPRPSV